MSATSSPSVSHCLAQFVPLCLEALPRMLSVDTDLFCHRERRTPSGLVTEGQSVRYTAMTVIGLSIAKKRGIELPASLDTDRFAIRLSQERQVGLGDLGLIVWALALAEPQLASQVTDHLLTRLQRDSLGPKVPNTMELAWLLIGLCYATHGKEASSELNGWGQRVSTALVSAFNPATGLFFRYPEGRRSPMHYVASFAMEIYPIYALAAYAERFDNEPALTTARTCADRLVGLQLADGGWPWMYDVRTGQVLETHPIFSVHQDAMAPMALGKLSRVSRVDYSAAIRRGISWLRGENVLGIPMVAEDLRTIWRAQETPCLGRLQPRLILNAASALLLGRGVFRSGSVRLVAECRPYHLGWLLLAALE